MGKISKNLADINNDNDANKQSKEFQQNSHKNRETYDGKSTKSIKVVLVDSIKKGASIYINNFYNLLLQIKICLFNVMS